MILRKKPFSDDRDFSDTIEAHAAERCNGPHLFWIDGRLSNKHVAFHAQLGQEGGRRFADVRIEIEWSDIIQCIEKLAERKNEQAIQLMALIKVKAK